CDLVENCTGSSASCPANSFASSAAPCTGASQGGVCDVDASDHCVGGANTCVDVFQSSSTVCRAAAGVCDATENCTRSSGSCPVDSRVASGVVCWASAGVCDPSEACDGINTTCPADAKSASGTVCRSSAGVCDLSEACDGSNAACPADAKSASGTV